MTPPVKFGTCQPRLLRVETLSKLRAVSDRFIFESGPEMHVGNFLQLRSHLRSHSPALFIESSRVVRATLSITKRDKCGTEII